VHAFYLQTMAEKKEYSSPCATMLRFEEDNKIWIQDASGRSLFLLVLDETGKIEAFVPPTDHRKRELPLVSKDPTGFRPKSGSEMDLLLAKELASKEVGDHWAEAAERKRLHKLIKAFEAEEAVKRAERGRARRMARKVREAERLERVGVGHYNVKTSRNSSSSCSTPVSSGPVSDFDRDFRRAQQLAVSEEWEKGVDPAEVKRLSGLIKYVQLRHEQS